MYDQRDKLQKQQKPILVLSMGNTFDDIRKKLGDFSDWIRAGLFPYQASVLDVKMDELPHPRDFLGIVISGSHHMVTEHLEWSEKVSDWLKHCDQLRVPILGICYGHQLLAYTFGGHVAENPRGLEIGTHSIALTEFAQSDALFQHNPCHFDGQLVHYQSVVRLPTSAVLLATNSHELHQAFRLGDRMWGVQFHPEFSAEAMQAYVEYLASQDNVQAKRAQVHETTEAAQLLRRFGQFCELNEL